MGAPSKAADRGAATPRAGQSDYLPRQNADNNNTTPFDPPKQLPNARSGATDRTGRAKPGTLFAPVPVRAQSDIRLSRTDHRVLQVIASYDGLGRNGQNCFASNQTIGLRAGIDKNRCTKIVQRLIEFGYVELLPHATDKRKSIKRVIYGVDGELEVASGRRTLSHLRFDIDLDAKAGENGCQSEPFLTRNGTGQAAERSRHLSERLHPNILPEDRRTNKIGRHFRKPADAASTHALLGQTLGFDLLTSLSPDWLRRLENAALAGELTHILLEAARQSVCTTP